MPLMRRAGCIGETDGTRGEVSALADAATGPAASDRYRGRRHPRGVGPTAPRASVRALNRLHALMERNRLWDAAAHVIETLPPLYRAFTWAEKEAKGALFGCRMCGQCALPSTAYTCPQTCPKQLRNGPCGGVSSEGACEVYPDMRCVWVIAYERADEAGPVLAGKGRVADLRRLQRPLDHRRWGDSSWVNYWRGRDEGLWTDDDGLGAEMVSMLEPHEQSAAIGGPL
jgi:hypothetical protein